MRTPMRHTARERGPERHAELRRARRRVRIMSGVRPVAVTSLVPGVVVWAHVPAPRSSRNPVLRPAVVSGRQGRTVRLRALTASVGLVDAAGYTVLVGWAEAGLDRPSAVFGFDVEVDRCEILEVTGELVDEDLQRCFPDAGHDGSGWDHGVWSGPFGTAARSVTGERATLRRSA